MVIMWVNTFSECLCKSEWEQSPWPTVGETHSITSTDKNLTCFIGTKSKAILHNKYLWGKCKGCSLSTRLKPFFDRFTPGVCDLHKPKRHLCPHFGKIKLTSSCKCKNDINVDTYWQQNFSFSKKHLFYLNVVIAT